MHLGRQPSGSAAGTVPSGTLTVGLVASSLRPYVPAVAVAADVAGPLHPLPASCQVLPIPPQRWDRWDFDRQQQQLGSGGGGGDRPASAQFGAFLAGVDVFDAAAFGMSAGEALAADPQVRGWD